MSLAADSLHSISDFLKIESVRGKEYKLMSKVFSDFELLNQMHFDKSFGAYFDFGNHTEKVRLSWKLVDGPNNILSRQLIREVLEEPILRFVPHIGYVSLFPFIWKIVPARNSSTSSQTRQSGGVTLEFAR
ncbi:alpha-glucosidase 2-like [Apium graveolens]|uniref:alpha-glucosidase 2-like n=1 Tax=Apium graveolens TaxID=4045 RepID=UPI003D7A984A